MAHSSQALMRHEISYGVTELPKHAFVSAFALGAILSLCETPEVLFELEYITRAS